MRSALHAVPRDVCASLGECLSEPALRAHLKLMGFGLIFVPPSLRWDQNPPLLTTPILYHRRWRRTLKHAERSGRSGKHWGQPQWNRSRHSGSRAVCQASAWCLVGYRCV